MKIYIYRGGSGWGGIEGSVLIDTTLKKYINFKEYFRWNYDHPNKKFPGKTGVDCLSSDISDYPKEVIRDFPYDISLLECFLDDCELFKKKFASMDQQIDEVYILTENSEVRKVFDTRFGFTCPANPALNAKLRKLVERMVS